MKKSISLARLVLTGLFVIPHASFASDDPLSDLKAKAEKVKAQKAAKIEAAQPKTAEVPATIDCTYKLPDNTTTNKELLSKWAESAAVQSFTFKPDLLDKELNALKACYTAQGWKAFNEALKTSGNLESIRTNSLTVTSHVSGNSTVNDMKDTQWKVTVPLQVTYQNNDKRLQQNLDVDLLVMLKKSGDLGIMQVIAVPTKDEQTKP